MKRRPSSLLLWLLAILPLMAGAFPPYGPPVAASGSVLGVRVTDMPFPELQGLGLDHGVRIVQVLPGSPAATAGLLSGDIVLALNAKPVYSSERLRWLVLQAGTGAELALDYQRAGKRLSAQLSLDGSRAPGPGFSHAPAGPVGAAAYLGVHLQAMTGPLRDAFGAPEGSGVLVARVVEASPAEQVGVHPGDIIVRIERKPVRSTDDVYRALDYFEPGDQVEIELIRASQSKTLTVTLGERAAGTGGDWWRRSEHPRDMQDFLPPPEYWQRLMDHMMQSLEDSMDDLRRRWPESESESGAY